MSTTINGTTGINKIQDGTVVDADIAALSASKLTGTLPAGMGGKVLQVVQGVSTSRNYFINSTSYQDTTIEATITPSSASSKVLVIVGYSMAQDDQNDNVAWTRILRGSTSIGEMAVNEETTSGGDYFNNVSFNYLDSPSTTSATTYKVQGKTSHASSDYRINWIRGYTPDLQVHKNSSGITLMEISG